MWSIFGLQFHLYGLILGLACLVAYYCINYKAHQRKIEFQFLEKAFLPVFIGGVIGARMYHVLTDSQYYLANWWAVIQITNGGLSVIGAVLGGALVLIAIYYFHPPRSSLITYLDLIIFGLPTAQFLGRLGNYFNHELYGLPSTLPWAISIPLANRLPGFEAQATYHPLFLYEMIFSAIAVLVMWYVEAVAVRRKTKYQIGSGWYFWGYLFYYCLVRFLLDFLRIDKSMSGVLGLGVNQLILLGLVFGIGLYWAIKKLWPTGQ